MNKEEASDNWRMSSHQGGQYLKNRYHAVCTTKETVQKADEKREEIVTSDVRKNREVFNHTGPCGQLLVWD